MVHDIILKLGPIVNNHWTGFESGKIYDLRMVDFAAMIDSGETKFPEGTEVYTSNLPDAWDEIVKNPEVVNAAASLHRTNLRFADMGVSQEVIDILRDAGLRGPYDLVGVKKEWLIALGISETDATTIFTWLKAEGFIP